MIDLMDALDTFLEARRFVQKERVMARLRPTLERRVGRAFIYQGDTFIRLLNEERDKWPVVDPNNPQQPVFPEWAPIWDVMAGETAARFADPIVATARFAMTAGGNALYDALALVQTFDLANPRAERYIARVGAELITGIQHTTKLQIRGIIGDALANGHSYDKLARSLLDRFSEFAIGKPQQHISSRAHLIAITEIANAYEEGNFEVADELGARGLVMEKAWSTSRDDRVSDGCLENEAADWIGIHDSFPSGDMHPPRFPGCRCAALYRRKQGAPIGAVRRPTPPSFTSAAEAKAWAEQNLGFRVAYDIDDVLEVMADGFESRYGFDTEHPRSQFVQNWKQKFKGIEKVDEDTAIEWIRASSNAVANGQAEPIPLVIRRPLPDGSEKWAGGEYLSEYILVIDNPNDIRQELADRITDLLSTAATAYNDEFQGIYIHEYGHHYTLAVRPNAGNVNAQVAMQDKTRKWIRENISYYASTNAHELAAEAYTLSRHPDYALLSDEVREFIEKVLGG